MSHPFVQQLQDSLDAARLLDTQQDHVGAASVLDAAINGGGAYDGESEEILLTIASLAQQCSREKARQEHRAALLNSYLYTR